MFKQIHWECTLEKDGANGYVQPGKKDTDTQPESLFSENDAATVLNKLAKEFKGDEARILEIV